jgi:hypothetical protein
MKLYDELADWWVLMSSPGHYAAEAGPSPACLIQEISRAACGFWNSAQGAGIWRRI